MIKNYQKLYKIKAKIHTNSKLSEHLDNNKTNQQKHRKKRHKLIKGSNKEIFP